MIEFVDVALLALIKQTCPSYITIWAPPEGAKSCLAKAAVRKQEKQRTTSPRNTVGMPGLTLFRLGISTEMEAFTMPAIHRGAYNKTFTGNMPELEGKHNFLNNIPIVGHYQITAVAKDRSDLNDIAKRLLFLRDYTTVTTSISTKKTNDPWVQDWSIFVDDPKTSWEVTPETGSVLMYKTTVDVRAYTILVKNSVAPTIEQIVINFKEIMEGEEVDLEQITILPKP